MNNKPKPGGCLLVVLLAVIALSAASDAEAQQSREGTVRIGDQGQQIKPREIQLPYQQRGTRTDPGLKDDLNRLEGQHGLGVYGNWYGPDWSGGQRPSDRHGQTGWLGPVDSLDEACMYHDLAYDKAAKATTKEEKEIRIKNADVNLLAALKRLDDDPSKWPKPAKDPELAKTYRDRAIKVFKLKLRWID